MLPNISGVDGHKTNTELQHEPDKKQNFLFFFPKIILTNYIKFGKKLRSQFFKRELTRNQYQMQQGLYEQIINKLVSSKLNDLDRNTYFIKKSPVDKVEASRILSQYLVNVIRFALNQLTGDDSIEKQILLSNNIIKLIRDELHEEEFEEDLIATEAKILSAIIKKIMIIRMMTYCKFST